MLGSSKEELQIKSLVFRDCDKKINYQNKSS